MISRLSGVNLKKSYFIFSNYLPLQIWTLKFCYHDISKTITHRSFKLSQLKEGNEKLLGENLEKSYLIFFNYLPLQIWTLKICSHDISKTIADRSFKIGPLIGNGV